MYIMTGKFLTYILRHNPAACGIELDKNGWANVDALLAGVQKSGRNINFTMLEKIVKTDDKGRFEFNAEKSRIRATYRHSLPVDLNLQPETPPDILYHGTAEKFSENIKQSGLTKKSRNFVHLSSGKSMAEQVGARHGKPVILRICAGQMAKDGYEFYQSPSGIWLTEKVPVDYIVFDGEI